MSDWTAKLRPLRDDFRPLSCFAADEPKPDTTLDVRAGLTTDLKYQTRATRRRFRDLRGVADAAAHLGGIPEPGETFHCVIKGTYPLWALVPAVAKLAGRIDALHVVTLSFSHQNAAELLAMLNDGRIGAVTFLVSHYFRDTSAEVYDPFAQGLKDRGQRLLAMRTHAKILLFALPDGRRVVVESSANLRSCKNVEQFAMTHDAGLYDFHRAWVEELFQ